jgi:hypothetical protein
MFWFKSLMLITVIFLFYLAVILDSAKKVARKLGKNSMNTRKFR